MFITSRDPHFVVVNGAKDSGDYWLILVDRPEFPFVVSVRLMASQQVLTVFLLAQCIMSSMTQPGSWVLSAVPSPDRVIRWPAVFALVVMGFLTGCSASSGPDQAVAGVPEEQQEPAETADGEAVSPAVDAADTEPQSLADYLGRAAGGAGPGGAGPGGGAGFVFDSDQVTQEQQLIQQAIQRCMQAQGFTYVPEEVGDGLRTFLATQNQGVSPADYAATAGFGISTAFDAILEGDFDFDESSDPNGEHLATLSAGEADAWELALQGEAPQRNGQGQLIDPETGELVQGNRPGQASGGCRLAAQTEVRGEPVDLSALEDNLVALEERIEADPRVTEIRRDWVDCMSVEGFDYTDEAEARGDINSQLRPLLRSFFMSADGGANQPGPRQAGGNIAQAVSGLKLTAEQEAELERLQDLERSVATASLGCQGDTGAELEAITLRYEEAFIDANRAALEALGS